MKRSILLRTWGQPGVRYSISFVQHDFDFLMSLGAGSDRMHDHGTWLCELTFDCTPFAERPNKRAAPWIGNFVDGYPGMAGEINWVWGPGTRLTVHHRRPRLMRGPKDADVPLLVRACEELTRAVLIAAEFEDAFANGEPQRSKAHQQFIERVQGGHYPGISSPTATVSVITTASVVAEPNCCSVCRAELPPKKRKVCSDRCWKIWLEINEATQTEEPDSIHDDPRFDPEDELYGDYEESEPTAANRQLWGWRFRRVSYDMLDP